MIEKGKVEISADQRETFIDTIIVHNTGDKLVSARAYWEDFMYVEPFNGNKKFSPAGSTKYSCAQWVNYNPQEFTIPPFGKREISYVINVPPEARGGYYGVLFFEDNKPTKQEQTGFRIVTRVGCLFFIETKGSAKEAEVNNLGIINSRLQGNIANKGETILIPHGIFYIMNKEGLVVDRGELEKKYIPPAEEASFEKEISENLPMGEYMLVLTFDLGKGDAIVREIDFEKGASSDINVTQIRD